MSQKHQSPETGLASIRYMPGQAMHRERQLREATDEGFDKFGIPKEERAKVTIDAPRASEALNVGHQAVQGLLPEGPVAPTGPDQQK